MRYFEVETVSFITALGQSVPIKDIRFRPGRAVTAYSIDLGGSHHLDEIATRPDVFGAGVEGESHRLFEENDVEIVDAVFDLSRIKSLRVPL